VLRYVLGLLEDWPTDTQRSTVPKLYLNAVSHVFASGRCPTHHENQRPESKPPERHVREETLILEAEADELDVDRRAMPIRQVVLATTLGDGA
jgi:hypothetical protein